MESFEGFWIRGRMGLEGTDTFTRNKLHPVKWTDQTLSTSDDVEDRETEKGRLEEAYEKCDRDLDELIVQHYTELTTAIRTYQSITERITNSRNKIRQVKENLLSCKMLLHCKRDELRKLWIEGIEHKHVLNLLDEIENIKQVPQKLEQCMASKRYLNATDML
ncbi:PREDICTED: exocyst complex component 4-like, partial [Apaloderma vittatum]|uniref:exocyst complex component 4-like n=1 Tax=Apaloderma vittatum TaxID=57397 RepID=UPI0005217690